MNKNIPASIILLGASNLARGYYSLTRCIKNNLGSRPVSFFNALGPGRAYCAFGGVMNVAYPPIGSSPVFSSAKGQAHEASRKIALLTDLGNDIMYGVPVEKIVAEIRRIIRQLETMDADTLITPVPATLISQLTPARFRILKAVFFPRSAVDRLEAIAAIKKINQAIDAGLGDRVTVIRGLENFMGWDKIHYGHFNFAEVWSRIAGAVLLALGAGMREKICLLEAIPSYAMNLNRLILSDMLHLTRKGPEFF
jgi:hypothetical protein